MGSESQPDQDARAELGAAERRRWKVLVAAVALVFTATVAFALGGLAIDGAGSSRPRVEPGAGSEVVVSPATGPGGASGTAYGSIHTS